MAKLESYSIAAAREPVPVGPGLRTWLAVIEHPVESRRFLAPARESERRTTTRAWYLLAEECTEKLPPRYLIPATRSAFEISEIQCDRHYAVVRAAVEQGAPLPNRGFYERRKKLKERLLAEIPAIRDRTSEVAALMPCRSRGGDADRGARAGRGHASDTAPARAPGRERGAWLAGDPSVLGNDRGTRGLAPRAWCEGDD
jgi:hypothetical protein